MGGPGLGTAELGCDTEGGGDGYWPTGDFKGLGTVGLEEMNERGCYCVLVGWGGEEEFFVNDGDGDGDEA